MKSIISKHSVLVKTKNQVSCDLEGEAVILNHKNGYYYGLEGTGNRIWRMLEKPVRLDELKERIASEYGSDPHRCESDIIKFLKEMRSEGLIEIRNDLAS